MLCQECPSRSICQSECPELTLHLKEIEVPQREKTIGLPRHGRIPWGSTVSLTKTEREIVTLLAKGLSRGEICKSLDITRNSFRRHLSTAKKKHEES